MRILELGGANSCFLDSILARFAPASYDVVDSNAYGLSLLAGRQVRTHQQDILSLSLNLEADLVFSVGLVEHFDAAGTRAAILSHFDALRPGGVAIITFPTPTWLYRASRAAIARAGLWKFPDERPLRPAEVIAAIEERATVLCARTLWPLILTQHLVAARKR